MTTGVASASAEDILDALCASVTWSEPAANHIQLHTGDPGGAGTANQATETDRVQATFGTASTAAGTTTISNTADLEWTAVAGSETYSYFSAWDSGAGGNFLYSGTVTANAVTAGDDFTIAIGDLDVTLSVAAT